MLLARGSSHVARWPRLHAKACLSLVCHIAMQHALSSIQQCRQLLPAASIIQGERVARGNHPRKTP